MQAHHTHWSPLTMVATRDVPRSCLVSAQHPARAHPPRDPRREATRLSLRPLSAKRRKGGVVAAAHPQQESNGSSGADPVTTVAKGTSPSMAAANRDAPGQGSTAVPAAAAAGPAASVPWAGNEEGGACETECAFDGEDGPARVMCCDYGFRSGGMRLSGENEARVPGSLLSLAVSNFRQEWTRLRRSFRFNEYEIISRSRLQGGGSGGPVQDAAARLGGAVVSSLSTADAQLEQRGVLGTLRANDEGNGSPLAANCQAIREKLSRLTLDDDAVARRERSRPPMKAAWPIRLAFDVLCLMLDLVYKGRPIQRFWVLETVARIPYFSFISMLHLYESLGWWRAAAKLRGVHFAEEWNELHHLMIMESLGGDQLWVDRFLAQHAAVIYYWVCVVLFAASPSSAYNFGELVETHAADTYSQFFEENEEMLRSLPPPLVAVQYYRSADLYLFDAFQTAGPPPAGMPAAASLPTPTTSSSGTGWSSAPPAAAAASSGNVALNDSIRSNGGGDLSTAAAVAAVVKGAKRPPRRPACDTLYDVFVNIRDDEMEHIYTMVACKDADGAVNCSPK